MRRSANWLIANRRRETPFLNVFKTVRNAAIDIHRREQRDRKLSESLFNGYLPPAKSTDPQSELLSAERDQILRQAIDNLS